MEASIDARIGLDDDVASENDSPPVDPEVIAARNVHSPFMPATSDQIGTLCSYLSRRREALYDRDGANRQDPTSPAPPLSSPSLTWGPETGGSVSRPPASVSWTSPWV